MVVRLRSDGAALLVPEGTRLVHVGLPKTGTTGLQRGAAQQRSALRRQGVLYPGENYHHREENYALLGRSLGLGVPPPDRSLWTRLAEQARDTEVARVWLDSESFYSLPRETALELLRDVGGEPHVVLTVRSLPAQVGSAWSEYLKQGFRMGFRRWARGVLSDPPRAGLTPAYPHRTDVSGRVRDWVDLVGADRVTVVALDPADRDLVPRTFETLLGLTPGTLTDVALDGYDSNRSFTLAEAELVRGLNKSARARDDLDVAQYLRLLRQEVVLPLLQRTPGPDEVRILPPQWAVQRLVELAEEHRRAIEAMDVRLVGDLAELARPVPGAAEKHPLPDLPLAAAEATLVASVRAGFAADKALRDPYAARNAAVRQARTRELAGALRRRALGRLPLTRSRPGQ